MTIQELDRLVTKTAITPASKRALKDVRRAVMTGVIGDPVVGQGFWSVAFDTSKGMPVKMTFSLTRKPNGKS